MSAPAPRPFVKVEGLGNDFLLVDARHEAAAALRSTLAALRERAASLCDRRRGVGGDGVLVVAPPTTAGAVATMIVVNADGSRPQMCGNGLRCVAAWLHREGAPAELTVDTDAGPRACEVWRGDGSDRVAVDMGPAVLSGAVAPAHGDGRSFARVSMGNPHAVAFTAPGEDPEALARTLGPGLERDAAFPEGTNVEFARLEPDGGLTLWVWERGCGITDACGTGACATVAAAVAGGHRPTGVDVHVALPGGVLVVRAGDDGRVRMTGPARLVFRGELPG